MTTLDLYIFMWFFHTHPTSNFSDIRSKHLLTLTPLPLTWLTLWLWPLNLSVVTVSRAVDDCRPLLQQGLLKMAQNIGPQTSWKNTRQREPLDYKANKINDRTCCLVKKIHNLLGWDEKAGCLPHLSVSRDVVISFIDLISGDLHDKSCSFKNYRKDIKWHSSNGIWWCWLPVKRSHEH